MSHDSANNVTELLRDRVRLLLKEKAFELDTGVTEIVEQLSPVVDRSPETIFRWLRENSVPQSRYQLIAHFFSVTVEWLKTGEGQRTPSAHKGSVGDIPTKNMQGGNDLHETVNNSLTLVGGEDHEKYNPYREIERAILKLIDLDRMTELINHGAGKVQEAFDYAFRQVYKGAVYRIRFVVYVEKEEEEDTPLAPSPNKPPHADGE